MILTKKQINHKEKMDRLLNPISIDSFDPENFEPLASPEELECAYRKRVKPPKKLPTFGLKPKEIMDGQLIGMYESKQDIYLVLAHCINDLRDEIDLLKAKIK